MDLVGRIFGDLTVEWFGGKTKKSSKWVCRCVCDSVGIYGERQLLKFGITHCGCKGGVNHVLYPRFVAMIYRCYNKNAINYDDYGGRGIKVCDRWMESNGRGFENFLSDMCNYEDGLTLDRIDPDGDYEPANCRWVTQKVQHFNTRKSVANTSGRTGVSVEEDGRYTATIRIDGLVKSLGVFDSFIEAVRAREMAEIEEYGFSKEQ